MVARIDSVVVIGYIHVAPKEYAVTEFDMVRASDVDVICKTDTTANGDRRLKVLIAMVLDCLDSDSITGTERSNGYVPGSPNVEGAANEKRAAGLKSKTVNSAVQESQGQPSSASDAIRPEVGFEPSQRAPFCRAVHFCPLRGPPAICGCAFSKDVPEAIPPSRGVALRLERKNLMVASHRRLPRMARLQK